MVMREPSNFDDVPIRRGPFGEDTLIPVVEDLSPSFPIDRGWWQPPIDVIGETPTIELPTMPTTISKDEPPVIIDEQLPPIKTIMELVPSPQPIIDIFTEPPTDGIPIPSTTLTDQFIPPTTVPVTPEAENPSTTVTPVTEGERSLLETINDFFAPFARSGGGGGGGSSMGSGVISVPVPVDSGGDNNYAKWLVILGVIGIAVTVWLHYHRKKG